VILARLKAATHARHQLLERRSPLLDPALTLGRYRETLAALHAYYRPLEARLAALPDWGDVELDLAVRWKTPLLARDLDALGLGAAERDARPACAVLPSVRDCAHGLGCLYVLEGATLGGRVVMRRLAERLPVTPVHCGAFLSGYGEQTGPMWARFGAVVTDFAARHAGVRGVETSIVAAARTAFSTLTRWMEHSLAHGPGESPGIHGHDASVAPTS
jgi:heme oxygenase